MKVIQIPGGQVVLRDRPEEIRVRHHRLLDNALVAASEAFQKLRAAKIEGDGDEVRVEGLTRLDAAALMERQDAQMAALIVSWTRKDGPAPDSVEAIQDLDRDTYDAILAGVREIGMGVFGRTDFSVSPDPDRPTVPSGGSETSETDVPESKSSRASSNGSPSISTDESSPELLTTSS